MSLSVGTRLGPYLIEAPLGAGGMGEVYRARDTRLGRTVAIKLLAPHLTSHTEYTQRFEREARAIATLDHPHICAIFDVGEHEGRSYLVMQHLEGETLATRLTHGPLAIEIALEYAEALARALASAHRAGVVHRDVKPGNIMVTPSGIKLLDFGVAQVATDALSSASGGQDSATVSASLTMPGAVPGTLRYMAPEQLEGKRADARTDIFACGAVVYEMVTGLRPFSADTQAGLIVAVLTMDPPAMSTARSGVPAASDRVVKKCLAKDPDDRWQSASDLADEFNWIRESLQHATIVPTLPKRSSLRETRTWLLILAAALAAIAGTWLVLAMRSAREAVPIAFEIVLPQGEIGRLDSALAFSGDGRHLAYSAVVDGRHQVFVRTLDEVVARQLTATTTAMWPFFSPNGQSLAFATPAGLAKVPLNGGAPEIIAKTRGFTAGAAWNERGDVVFPGPDGLQIVNVADRGGSQRTLTPAPPQGRPQYPSFLPGGRVVIFSVRPAQAAWYDGDILAQSLDGGEPTLLVRGAAQARYAPSGHLVYARAGTLFAVPFDANSMRVTGAPVAVLEGVREMPNLGVSQFAVSPEGALAYVPGGLLTSEVLWVDRRGRVEPLMRDQLREQFYQPRLSPDGRHLAIVMARGDDDVWIYELERHVLSRFTSGANHGMPLWSPDGQRLLFRRGGSDPILWQPVDRSTPPASLTLDEAGPPNSWSRDGRLLTYTRRDETTGFDIWVFDAERRAARPVIATRFEERSPMVSPDGRWLAYVSDESGRFEIYVHSFPTGSQRWRVSHDGGTEPLWARDGNELFFRQGDTLMAAQATQSPPFSKPEALFTLASWLGNTSRTNYDVASDGRFVIVKMSEPEGTANRIRVVLNWADQLKKLAPK